MAVTKIFQGDPFTSENWVDSQGSPNRNGSPGGASNTPAYLEINPTAATEYVFYQDWGYWGDSPSRITCGSWVAFNSIPSATTTFLELYIDGIEFYAQVLSSGVIRLSNADGTSTINTSTTAVAGTEYWVEMAADTSANPWVVQLKVNANSPVQLLRADAPISLTSSHFHLGPTGSATLTAFYRLPTQGIPDTSADFLGPQTFPSSFEFVTQAHSGAGSTDGIAIDFSFDSFPTSPAISVGDSLFFGIHVLDSVKASVACTGGRATRVTDWVTGEADSFGVPAYSVWKGNYDGTDLYNFTWNDTGGRGSSITCLVLSGDQPVVQFVTGTNTASTASRTSPTINATSGNKVLVFHGGSAVDDLPFSWRAPAYPISDEEFYGMNSIGLVEGASGISVKGRPGGSTACQSMWILLEVGDAVAGTASAPHYRPAMTSRGTSW